MLIKVFLSRLAHQVTIHTIRLPKQSTVGDVLNDLKTKVKFSASRGVCVSMHHVLLRHIVILVNVSPLFIISVEDIYYASTSCYSYSTSWCIKRCRD